MKNAILLPQSSRVRKTVVSMLLEQRMRSLQIRELVSVLPLNNEGDVYTSECQDDLNRACENMAAMKGDPRYLLSEISDGHVFFETKKTMQKIW